MFAPESALRLQPRRCDGAGVSLTEQRGGLVMVAARRGRAADLGAALQALLGLDVPEAGRATVSADATALWIAPQTALIQAPPEKLAALRTNIARDIAATIDQSGGFAILRLAGPKAVAALAKICRIDLHASAFGPDRVARTVMAQVPAILHQVDDAPTYDIIVPYTLARSFAGAIIDAAEEFALAISAADEA